jgi:hypothetical protein
MNDSIHFKYFGVKLNKKNKKSYWGIFTYNVVTNKNYFFFVWGNAESFIIKEIKGKVLAKPWWQCIKNKRNMYTELKSESIEYECPFIFEDVEKYVTVWILKNGY